jgi:hypothetical protein
MNDNTRDPSKEFVVPNVDPLIPEGSDRRAFLTRCALASAVAVLTDRAGARDHDAHGEAASAPRFAPRWAFAQLCSSPLSRAM